MADSFLLFFILAGNCLVYLFSKSILRRHRVQFYFHCLLLGIVIGLAVGVKLNGGLVLFLFWLLSLLLLFLYKLDFVWRKRLLWGNILVVLISFAIFILLNPFLYSHPFRNSAFMLRARIEDSLSHQGNVAGRSADQYPSEIFNYYQANFIG